MPQQSTRAFIHGCNYPWSTDGRTIFYGLDFGANVWGSHIGVSTRASDIARDFAEMAALGFTATRWFLFADGRAGIEYDGFGTPAGPDAFLFRDLDCALEIAARHGIRIDLVLFDHRWMFKGVRDTLVDEVTGNLLEARMPHGRANVFLTSRGRDALFHNVISPVVRRYAPGGERADLAPQILSYEFMNEPDFVLEEWERDLSRHVTRPLRFEVLAGMVSQLSAIVHAHSPALTTLGGARTRNLWAWDDDSLGLDLLQIHTYPDELHPDRDEDPFGLAASQLSVHRPVLLGEFPGNGPVQHPPGASPPDRALDEYLEFALASGYAGAWPWSFSGTDHYGRLPSEPLHRFALRYPELVNSRFDPHRTEPHQHHR